MSIQNVMLMKGSLMNKKQLVKKSNNLIESRCNLNLSQQKLVLAVISQINRGDDDFKEYCLSIAEFKRLMNIKSGGYYLELRKSAEDLVTKKLVIPRGERRELITTWFSSIEIDYEGQIGFMFDIKLRPYLLQLKQQFTCYQLKNILLLRSKYSIRLYELLKQYQNLECRCFKLSEFREMLYIEPEKYTRFSDFKKRVLEASKKDINKHTDIQISYSLKKTGRNITGIVFCIEGKSPPTSEVPLDLVNMIPEKWRHNAADIAGEIFQKAGPDELKQCIEFVNGAIAGGQEIKKGYGPYLRAVHANGWQQRAAAAQAADEAAAARATEEKEQAFLESRRQMPDAVLIEDARKGCSISQQVLDERKMRKNTK